MTILEIAEKLSDFGDDKVGGAKWLKANFDRFPEPAKSQIYQFVMDQWDQFPKEARDILAGLSFRCEAGRKRMIENLDAAASKLPDGKMAFFEETLAKKTKP